MALKNKYYGQILLKIFYVENVEMWKMWKMWKIVKSIIKIR